MRVGKLVCVIVCAICCAVCGASAFAQNPPDPALKNEVDITWAVKIPLRDGVKVNATLYRPHNSAPVPAIFTLTPYIGDTYHARAMYFAQHGYVYLLVDVRGRGN